MKENSQSPNLPDLTKLSLSELADMIDVDWSNMSPYAQPYVSAMLSLKNISDMYYADTGSSVVAYFLANAQTWRGPVARAVKAELNRRLKNVRKA